MNDPSQDLEQELAALKPRSIAPEIIDRVSCRLDVGQIKAVRWFEHGAQTPALEQLMDQLTDTVTRHGSIGPDTQGVQRLALAFVELPETQTHAEPKRPAFRDTNSRSRRWTMLASLAAGMLVAFCVGYLARNGAESDGSIAARHAEDHQNHDRQVNRGDEVTEWPGHPNLPSQLTTSGLRRGLTGSRSEHDGIAYAQTPDSHELSERPESRPFRPAQIPVRRAMQPHGSTLQTHPYPNSHLTPVTLIGSGNRSRLSLEVVRRKARQDQINRSL